MSYTPPIGAATTTSRGIVKLAGDLAGNADLPTVPGLAAKAGAAITIQGSSSLSGGGDLTANRTLSLVNDSATPGNTMYYGTNGTGTKGYYALPSATPVATTTTSGTITLAGDLAGTGASPTVAKVNGVSMSGTPQSGYVPVASSATAATWGTVNDATAVKLAGSTMTGTLILPSLRVTGGTLGAGKVLTSDASGNATWQSPSASNTNAVSKNTAYTAVPGDYIIADATTAFTVTLPTAATAGNGAMVSVKKVDSSTNAVTIVVSGGGAIDNVTSDAISTQWQSHDYLSNGTQWYLV